LAIIERKGSIYGANRLLTLKENAERDLYHACKDYENKKKEALEDQKKTEKIEEELDSINKDWKNS